MSSETTKSARFYEFLAWLETNRKQVVIAVAAAALLVLVISLWVWLRNQKELEANAALLKVGSSLLVGEGGTGPSAESYLKVAIAYASTQAGERAALLAAGAYFSEQKFADALAQFKNFQATHPGSKLAPQAAIGIAASLEAQSKLDEAVQAYQDLEKRYGSDPVASQAKLALGRLFEYQKKPEQALKLYDDLVRGASVSAWAAEARDQREQLLAKYPILATNATTGTMLTPVVSATNLLQTNLKSLPTNPPLAKSSNAASRLPTNLLLKPATNVPMARTNLSTTSSVHQPAVTATNKPKPSGTNR